MAQPRSYKELIEAIGDGMSPAFPEASRLVEALTALVRQVANAMRSSPSVLKLLQPNHLRTVALFNGFFSGKSRVFGKTPLAHIVLSRSTGSLERIRRRGTVIPSVVHSQH